MIMGKYASPIDPDQSQRRSKISRRDFLRISALTAGAVVLGAVTTRRLLEIGELKRVHESRILMGSVANLTLVSDDEAQALQAIRETFAVMERLEGILSRFRTGSQLSRLNRDGYLVDPDRVLVHVLASAQNYSDLTSGAFDITVEPLLELYRQSSQTGTAISQADVDQARRLIDYRQIEQHGERITFAKTGMAVTLDGIAKGYVIDEGAGHLADLGYRNVLVEVGGDLYAQGNGEDDAWRIGVQKPDAKDAMLAVARISKGGMATSGDYLNAFTADHSLNHIIDPRSGLSPITLSSVSVAAPSACAADVLSTSVMVMGPEQGLALVARLPDVEALLVTKDGQVIRSPGFPAG